MCLHGIITIIKNKIIISLSVNVQDEIEHLFTINDTLTSSKDKFDIGNEELSLKIY